MLRACERKYRRSCVEICMSRARARFMDFSLAVQTFCWRLRATAPSCERISARGSKKWTQKKERAKEQRQKELNEKKFFSFVRANLLGAISLIIRFDHQRCECARHTRTNERTSERERKEREKNAKRTSWWRWWNWNNEFGLKLSRDDETFRLADESRQARDFLQIILALVCVI